MNACEYILSKQSTWAKNRGLKLIGSKGQRGRPQYTKTLKENLFQPLDKEAREQIDNGAGKELKSDNGNPPKMQCLHSSSALGVNIFHYWKTTNQIPVIAAECGFCNSGTAISKEIVFEDKYPIGSRSWTLPHIDVVIHNEDSSKCKLFAIECKFTEAYGGKKHLGLKEKYLKVDEIWNDIPNLQKLAKSICPDDNDFKHLHPAQLIKHILGLKKDAGKEGFRLLYLYYDALGQEGAVHRQEIDEFKSVAEADKIKFHALSYQDLITRLDRKYRPEHEEYIKYLTSRYL